MSSAMFRMLGTGMAGDARRRSRRGRGGHLGGFRAGAGGRGSKYRGSAASADTADTAASQRGVQSPTIKGSCSRPNPKKAKLSQGRTADAAAVGEDSATCPGAGGMTSGAVSQQSSARRQSRQQWDRPQVSSVRWSRTQPQLLQPQALVDVVAAPRTPRRRVDQRNWIEQSPLTRRSRKR